MDDGSEIKIHAFKDDSRIPSNRLCVVLYRRGLAEGSGPEAVLSLFAGHGLPDERPAVDEAISVVALPRGDPVFGENGPLVCLWRDGGFAGRGAIG